MRIHRIAQSCEHIERWIAARGKSLGKLSFAHSSFFGNFAKASVGSGNIPERQKTGCFFDSRCMCINETFERFLQMDCCKFLVLAQTLNQPFFKVIEFHASSPFAAVSTVPSISGRIGCPGLGRFCRRHK